MKIIVSHDIDHLSPLEHYKDLILPKFYVRSHIELFKGSISFKEFANRFFELFTFKWNYIQEIMDFNDSRNIKSDFFIGVNNGLGLNYSLEKAKIWIEKINQRGFGIGVHGIDFDNLDLMQKEFTDFKKSTPNMPQFGIRMHYLRTDENTIDRMSEIGYQFDSTEIGYKNPYLVGDMWEFPLQIMEGWLFYKGKRYQNVSLKEAKEETIKLIDKANDANLQYLNILMHDRYYCNSFSSIKNWYEWIIDTLLEKGYEFCTYQEAVNQLNSNLN